MAGTLGIQEYELSQINLIASSNFGPVVLNKIVTGGSYTAGTVMGRITANGKFKNYDASATDGSEEPVGILLEDVDATDADVVARIGFAGVYIKDKITGLDAAAEGKLEAKAIYFK